MKVRLTGPEAMTSAAVSRPHITADEPEPGRNRERTDRQRPRALAVCSFTVPPRLRFICCDMWTRDGCGSHRFRPSESNFHSANHVELDGSRPSDSHVSSLKRDRRVVGGASRLKAI